MDFENLTQYIAHIVYDIFNTTHKRKSTHTQTL